jgi:hypothetical protein
VISDSAGRLRSSGRRHRKALAHGLDAEGLTEEETRRNQVFVDSADWFARAARIWNYTNARWHCSLETWLPSV